MTRRRVATSPRTALLTAQDLGPNWRTSERSYDRTESVERATFDRGLEEDGASCSTIVLLGSPDGVKVDVASHLLTLEGADGQSYIRTAAAVFPAEKNAKARADAYARSFHACANEMRSVFRSFGMPKEVALRVRVTSRALRLPGDIGVRIITRYGKSARTREQQHVLIRRGLMIAGFSMYFGGHPRAELNVEELAKLVAQRVERTAPTLRPSPITVPVFSPDPAAELVARSALSQIRDYPARWRRAADAEHGPDSGTAVYPGSLLRALDNLAPTRRMLGRAACVMLPVGWSHYIGHYIAIYRTERLARMEARRALQASLSAAESRHRRSQKITFVEGPVIDDDPDIQAIFRTKRCRMGASRRLPAIDVTSTDALAVIRRGRMVATYACAAKGESYDTMQALVKMVVRRLERSEQML